MAHAGEDVAQAAVPPRRMRLGDHTVLAATVARDAAGFGRFPGGALVAVGLPLFNWSDPVETDEENLTAETHSGRR